jgi:hypothetical protein
MSIKHYLKTYAEHGESTFHDQMNATKLNFVEHPRHHYPALVDCLPDKHFDYDQSSELNKLNIIKAGKKIENLQKPN